jgi:hypothetical protein
MRWKILILASLLYWTALIPLAGAQRITTLGVQCNANAFSWTFQWDRTLPTAAPGVTGELYAPACIWNPQLLITNVPGGGAIPDVFSDFRFGAFHLIGPHPEDVNPGDFFSFDLLSAFTLGGTGGLLVPLAGAAGAVNHSPHLDSYSILYAQIGVAGLPTFVFSGVHIPEPSTLSLLALGGLGLAIALWRGRKVSGRAFTPGIQPGS